MIRKNDEAHLEPFKVLVADDDAIFRQLADEALRELGYVAVEAIDGAQALDVLGGPAIGLAIVDLQMPNIDGLALIRCIRATPRIRHMPIIVVTSRTDRTAIDDAFEAGATSFLTKPVHWPTFGSQVKYLLLGHNILPEGIAAHLVSSILAGLAVATTTNPVSTAYW